jgi:hypothetical protein
MDIERDIERMERYIGDLERGETNTQFSDACWTALRALTELKFMKIKEVPLIITEPVHMCRYSKSMHQVFPRKCVDCGKSEPEQIFSA